MRILLAFALLCGAAVAADSPEQQDADAQAVVLLTRYGEWRIAYSLIEHLAAQGHHEGESFRAQFEQKAPPDVRENLALQKRAHEDTLRARRESQAHIAKQPARLQEFYREAQRQAEADDERHRLDRISLARDMAARLARDEADAERDRLDRISQAQSMAASLARNEAEDRKKAEAREREAARLREEEQERTAQRVREQEEQRASYAGLSVQERNFKIWQEVKKAEIPWDYAGTPKYEIFLDPFSLAHEADFNFTIHYNFFPQGWGDVQEDFVRVIFMVHEVVSTAGVTGSFTIRVRAHAQGSIRYGKAQTVCTRGQIGYISSNPTWWEWTDGE